MKARDLTVLAGVILIIVMLIIPLPPFLLDVLIIFNISLSLLILLVAISTKDALDFSIFPTMLLLVTLFRLGLSVSTTRSILGNAEAGNVIDTFGSFVIGGNAVVGFIVFLILIVIQFIVITKGAERVSEVGARFTLDAMPGKQMSIDADLNAGLISDREAKQRREKIEREADFYGSMDGASKFVKGDAIASIIIVIINMLGGLMIGMMQKSMDMNTAASTYTLLTVGDGLVTQIPALLISTATGVIVTKAASEGNLSTDLSRQILAYPKLLYVTAATIFLLGLATPITKVVTFSIAGLLAFAGYRLSKASLAKANLEEALLEEVPPEEPPGPESVVQLLQMDPIEFEFGYGLIPLADANQGGDLLDRVVMIRKQMALELGSVIPVIRIRDNISLEPNSYTIKVKGTVVAKGEVLLDHYMAMSTGEQDDSIIGIETIEPAFGLPALWVDEDMRDRADMAGYTVVDPPTVISTHLTEVLKAHAHELLGREETKQLIDHLKESYPTLVEEVTPNPLTTGDIQKVLRNLLREQLSIRNLPVIFEALADYGPLTKDMNIVTEYVRQALSRQITTQLTNGGNELFVITLAAAVEKKIADAIGQNENGSFLALAPADSQAILQNTAKEVQKVAELGRQAVILCSPAVRMHMRQLIERHLPHVPVVSYNELEPDVEVQSVGVVNAE
ncbi:flagellar biosynthesis protein FlhA [Shouchella clausii]|uniref:flagellar biosynthesis protein FlhA n=1 Tax=Shouchella clausii TaxID=79880 RepID=UPI002E206A27|nr:flagellar biosynthesis protein FlhA [Shouchella clausii]MED4157747.1 flagellar biosynthesis protein FlhA [Shouchella clausii]MED4175214.1 flagellar biosynthesis protein FlhA [Shouchella clausii]